MKKNVMNEVFKKVNCLTVEQEKSVLMHVMEFYIADMEQDDMDDIKEGLRCIKHDRNYGIVSGGCVLIYNGDINNYIKSLGIDFQDTIEAYEIYKYLVNMVIDYYIDDIIVATVGTGTVWTYKKYFIGSTVSDVLDYFIDNDIELLSYQKIDLNE